MKIYGQIEQVQLENIAAATTTPASRGRIFADTSNTSDVVVRVYDGVTWAPLLKRNMTTQWPSSDLSLNERTEIALVDATGASRTITLPSATTLAYKRVRIQKFDNTMNTVTIAAYGTEHVNSVASIMLCTYREYVDLFSDGSEWFILDHCYYRKGTTFTPTGSWSTNTTYTGKWWRDGDRANLRIHLALSGAPTAAALTLNLPSGLVIDTAKFPSTPVASKNPLGTGIVYNGGAPFRVFIFYNDTTSVRVKYIYASGGVGTPHYHGDLTNTVPVTIANTDVIDVDIVGLPMTNWIG